MFQKTKNKGPGDQLGQTNRIVDQTVIKGDIEAVADLRFDGHLEGNMKVKGRVVIGPLARITGNIICQNADVEGQVFGSLYVEELLLVKENAKIKGDLIIGKLAVEQGGDLEVTCKMLGDHKIEPALLANKNGHVLAETSSVSKGTEKKKK